MNCWKPGCGRPLRPWVAIRPHFICGESKNHTEYKDNLIFNSQFKYHLLHSWVSIWIGTYQSVDHILRFIDDFPQYILTYWIDIFSLKLKKLGKIWNSKKLDFDLLILLLKNKDIVVCLWVLFTLEKLYILLYIYCRGSNVNANFNIKLWIQKA